MCACPSGPSVKLCCSVWPLRSGHRRPTQRGLRHPGMASLGAESWLFRDVFWRNKARMSMKTKDNDNMALDQDIRSPLLRVAPCASFPRKRESIGLSMGPRFLGDDYADFHFLGRASADAAFERLRCATGAVRSNCAARPDLSLRDIAGSKNLSQAGTPAASLSSSTR